jgi:molecular chaperone Hsp33
MDEINTPSSDSTWRFLFEEADIRGQTVHLDRCFRDIIEIHQYAPGVSQLLGEFLAAAALLSSTLKFAGKLILQARSEGQIPLLMAECDQDYRLRAIARGAEEATAERFDQLLGGGQLVITIDPEQGQRYQGIAPLAGDSLAASLDAYFQQSEQLRTRFWLAAKEDGAAGMLLQQLPAQVTMDHGTREQQWEHACTLAQTVSGPELLELPSQQLLHRLFHQESLRVFDASPVEFSCNCSRERTFNALSTLGQSQVEELLEELGSITMDCEFCNQQYRFEREHLARILGQESDRTLH